MEMGLASDKILNAVVESLSVDELKAILAKKQAGNNIEGTRPKSMTERERLSEYYRRLMVSMGIVHPPKK